MEKIKHTPKQHRQAQDLAVALGHLNKGIPSLIDLYAAAPELLTELKKAHDKLVDNDLHFVRLDEKCAVCALIAKAEGRS